MDESTAIVKCNTIMDASSESNQAHNNAEHFANEPYQAGRPSSPMEDIKREEAAMNAPMTPSNTSSPVARHKHTLKGSKSTSMLRSVATPHPLSLSSSHNSLHHFQSACAMYASSPAPDVFGSSHNNLSSNSSNSSSLFSPNTPIGPLSAPSSPSFPNTALPSSVSPSSFMAMHGHNTSLYEPFRRNSVPILNVDQTEHKRKVSEEKHMHRQGSWSAMSSSPSMLNGPMHSMVGIPPPVLHQLDAAQLDPATMHYYRTQFSQQHVLQQHHLQHGLNQVMPSPNANNCQSPLSDNFMSAHAMNNGHSNSGPGHHSSTGAIRGSSKVKRNNSICSTTSVSSTGSGSNNKHPCKFPSCEWSFKRYEHLKRHMLVHTKERPFQCDFTGCNKSFSRSDNFSAHLRTHSKKALAHRRYDSRGLENGTKQEPQDSVQSMPSSTEQHSAGSIAGFIPHPSLHLSGGYSSGSSGQEASDYGREYSPPTSPGGTPVARPTSAMGTSSSMNDDDSFDMINHSGYSFGNNSIYSLDHLDHLNNMVPRFGTIRLDLKSVAPSDMHKSYEDEIQSEVLLTNANPNGESPRASPMPQYDQFAFQSSISTHFMPMMPTGFSSDQSDLQQQSQQGNMDPQSSHENMTSGSYSTDSFHHTAYHSDNDLKSLHYSPSPPSNEDSSHLHHPQPHHHSSYEAKAANPQMLHHASYPSLPPVSTSAALPPHPLMSMSSSPAPGLSEPLYSSSGTQAPHKGRQQSMAKLQLKQQQRQAQAA
ncbi:hypothetical protein BG011_004487 [Mortierella polycephala]|uniref:C2H2-type domain-containing protein n=1 Tax=Mortierella polycephala TaxID=41804 RepID=A0A9P6PY50_9FUNG|nr:hypothetical protein BG011_004487 [Mortierella polycephala]